MLPAQLLCMTLGNIGQPNVASLQPLMQWQNAKYWYRILSKPTARQGMHNLQRPGLAFATAHSSAHQKQGAPDKLHTDRLQGVGTGILQAC